MSLSEAFALSSRPLPPLSRIAVSLALRVATWEMRYRTRRHLTDLPDHLLRDIGLSTADASAEIEKPFWRG